MTKKEQAAFEALQNEIRLLKAWRLTEDVKPDVMPPMSGNGYTLGYVAIAWNDGGRIEAAVSDAYTHYTGEDNVERVRAGKKPICGSQRPRPLYSKRSDAMKHIRFYIEQATLKTLAALDKDIAAAVAAEAAETAK